jgi:hypothetical protein
MLRLLSIGLTVLVCLAGGYFGLACAMQRSVLFPAPPAGGADALARIPDAERIWLETNGARTEAWYLPPMPAESRPAPLVIFTHGNGELIDDWAVAFEPLRRWGAGVLLVEYPGYGRSTGSPSQRSIAATMTNAYDRMRARADVDPQRIIAYGRSLGGGAACALASERSIAALVLESTFTSVRPLALGFGLPGFLVRDPFDNLDVLRGYPGPVLIVHGERDEIIPVAHASALHAAAPRSRLALEPCGHNDCERPWLLVRDFLRENGLLERGAG